ncbi:site-specific integrase, partial [Bacteroides uniformis]
IEPRYKRQRAMRDMFLFMCFTGLSYVDLKAITYDNIHTDSDGGTWLMGNRIKTGVAYVVKLLPIAIELIEKYRGTDEKKDSPNVSFR